MTRGPSGWRSLQSLISESGMTNSNPFGIGATIRIQDIGEYRVVDELGSGRSGIVYAAVSDAPGALRLAIKAARPGISDELTERLLDEGRFLQTFADQLTGTIAAEAVPRVYAISAPPEPAFVALELVESPSAEAILTA